MDLNDAELAQALKERLDNLKDHVADYRVGKFERVKPISVELRELVTRTSGNEPLLFDLAQKYDVPLIVRRDIPPIKGLRAELSLEECLNEICFASTVPTPVKLTGFEFIKNFGNQIGAHTDRSLSDKLHRAKGDGLTIRGIPAHHAVLIDLAETVLLASKPLLTRIVSNLHEN